VTPDDLIAFEKDIAAEFEAGKIKAPVHFAGGNERELIEIFKGIRPQDWVLCQWRSHYHCLLKGVPSAEVKAAILAGRSISLCFPQSRILSSAIVGGIAPIATGLAWSIKKRGGLEWVYVFLGDMTADTGIVCESIRYASGHQLPIMFVIEDNGKSVCTDTAQAWGIPRPKHWAKTTRETGYNYKLTWPHVGTGTWVRF
jgi:TPP-dependent pyruvate/acetoin dehydrogenase alpha subunit